MDAARQQQLLYRIHEFLDEHTGDPSFDERARRLWLVDRLADYVSRWRGFCDHPLASETPLTNVPGFDAVSAGIEAVSQAFGELSTPEPMLSAWTAVRAAMDQALAHGGKNAAAEVQDRVIELQDLLRSAEA